ncbi:GNAT family N-acetyltransferase [Actinosynnema sp. CS-041913]|uniref:GNAT family N-acetyltransferase n=1 Tax=Actinosynnema sp. CS-041913 TaxID=3239917 RepID=UPI003D8D3CA5
MEVRLFDPERDDVSGFAHVSVAARGDGRPYWPEVTEEVVRFRLRHPFVGLGPAVYWAAYLDGRIVGHAYAQFPESESAHLALSEVTVHPDVRRRGRGAINDVGGGSEWR